MRKLRQQFVDSYRELKKLETIVMTALLIAIGIILGYFSIQLTDSIKIGISFVATQLTAVLYGPVVGGIMGGVADILKFIIKPTGAFFWGWTLNAIVGPVIYGMMLYKKKLTFLRIIVSKIVVAIVVNMFLGCLWSSMLYGKGFWVLMGTKAIQQVIQVPIQSVIFYIFVKALQRAKVIKNTVDEENSYNFQYICSFFVPLVGFILGAILLSKETEEQKNDGRKCIMLGVLSTVIISLIFVLSVCI